MNWRLCTLARSSPRVWAAVDWWEMRYPCSLDLSSFFSAILECTQTMQTRPGLLALLASCLLVLVSADSWLRRGWRPRGLGLWVNKHLNNDNKHPNKLSSDIRPNYPHCSAAWDPATPRPWQSPSRVLVGDFTILAWATHPPWQSLSRAHWDFPFWEIFLSRNLSRNPSPLQLWDEFSLSSIKVPLLLGQVLPPQQQLPLPLYPLILNPALTRYLFQPPFPLLSQSPQSKILLPKTSGHRNWDHFPFSRTR